MKIMKKNYKFIKINDKRYIIIDSYASIKDNKIIYLVTDGDYIYKVCMSYKWTGQIKMMDTTTSKVCDLNEIKEGLNDKE